MKQIFIIILLFFSLKTSAQLGGITIPSGHSSGTENLKLDATGNYLFSAEYNKVIMWNAKTGTQLYTFSSFSEKMNDYAISPDGSQIIISSWQNIISYNTVSGKELWQTADLTYVKTLIFSNDGKAILCGRSLGGSNTVYLIDPKTKQYIASVADGVESTGEPKFFKIDDNQIALATTGALRIISNDFKIIARKTIPNEGTAIAFLPGRKQFAITYGSQYQVVEALYSIEGSDINNLWKNSRKRFIPATNGDKFLTIEEVGKTYIHEAWLYDGNIPNKIALAWKFKGKNTVTGGIMNSQTGKIYLNVGNEIVQLDIKSGKQGQVFKREVADLGSELMSSLEYKYTDGKLNIMTEDSLYKSVDLFRMKAYRHVNTSIKSTQIVAFSSSGDTVGVFEENVSYLKNIATGKKILSVIPGAQGASSEDKNAFFFNKSGTKIYFVTFSDATQKTSLKKYDLVTKIVQTVIIARNFDNVIVHPDKTVIAYIEGDNLNYTVKVLNVETGTLLMNLKPAENKGGNRLFLSADKKKIMLTDNEFGFHCYRVSDGKLIIPPGDGILKNGFSGYTAINANLDLSLVFTGSSKGYISVYDANGTALYGKQVHESGVRSILLSPDNKFVYTISYDQTIKVLRAATGEILGTLYLFNDGNDYVFVGVDGRFDGSDGGMKRLYYIKNRAKISLDLVYEKFFTPNLYQRLVNGEVFDPINDNIKIAPQVRIAYAEIARNLSVEDDGKPNYNNTTGLAELTINATAPDDKVDEIRLFHNGKVVNLATRGLFVTDNDGNETKKYTINLLPGDNNFRAIALNSQRTESDADEITVSYAANGNQPTPKPVQNNNTVIISPIDKNATMYLMVVGINAYTNKINPLSYALPDATAFKEEIEKDAKSILAGVKTYFITDAKANRAGIINAFNEIKKDAKPQDVFVFYYAGHGYISPANKEFYLVSADVENGGESLLKNGIPAKELQQYAVDIQAQKQLFILDACQSAGAFGAMLQHDGEQQKSLAVVARSTGTHWMAASGSTETAKEFSELGHGAFTYVLLQALKGQAATNKMITVNGMKTFLQIQVPELVKKYGSNNQYPSSYGFGNDFPVEVLK